jgi:hypothetical protein
MKDHLLNFNFSISLGFSISLEKIFSLGILFFLFFAFFVDTNRNTVCTAIYTLAISYYH